jgi:hypothetical protein
MFKTLTEKRKFFTLNNLHFIVVVIRLLLLYGYCRFVVIVVVVVELKEGR